MGRRSFVATLVVIAAVVAGGYALTHRHIRKPIQQALGIDLSIFDFDSSDLPNENFETN